jgi:deazaflavin-dependent oxidoreductase (nitroreductase family)
VAKGRAAGRIGSNPAVVWAIRHLVSPLDRAVVRASRGRLSPISSFVAPTLLMTTVGRRSGRERTIPLVYIRDGESYLVANARPAGERKNPWVLNLRAAGSGRIRVGGRAIEVTAEELDDAATERWWPAFVAAWPAFGRHYAATGDRSIFVLRPLDRTRG